ncbi:MAG TPA: hypothetical protein VF426_07345 [Marmoricola sp.]
MNTETPHALATDYLAQLDHESRRLPADQAGDLVADIREHLSSALTGGESEARVREVLDRLGSPRALVDEALENAPAPTPPTAPTPPPAPVAAPGVGPYVDRLEGAVQQARRPGVWGGFETAALICLIGAEIGAVLLPFAGIAWVAGLVLLGISQVWTTREKLIGYLFLATGFPLAVVTVVAGMLALPFTVVSSVGVSCSGVATTGSGTLDGLGDQSCGTTVDAGGVHLALYVLIAIAVGYLLVQIYTVWRLLRARHRAPEAA